MEMLGLGALNPTYRTTICAPRREARPSAERWDEFSVMHRYFMLISGKKMKSVAAAVSHSSVNRPTTVTG